MPAAEPSVEAALVSALGEVREACAGVASAVAAWSAAVTVTLVIVCEAMCAVATVFALVRAGCAVSVVPFVVEAASWMPEAMPVTAETARTEAAFAEAPAMAVSVPSAGERRRFVPPEGTGELLERGHGGGEVVSGNRIGDLRSDAVDDVAETLFGCAAVVGQGPGAFGIRHPAEFDEPAEFVHGQLLRRLVIALAIAARNGAVDDVQQSPVASRDA